MNKKYEVLSINAGLNEVLRWIEDATRSRDEDLEDYADMDTSRSRVYSQPSSITDIIGTEKIGDIAVGEDSGTQYLYVIVDDSGDLEWRRVALSTF